MSSSKKTSALVLGMVMKREGITVNELKTAFGEQLSDKQLQRSLRSLEREGRISQVGSSRSYVPTDLLDRIQDSVARANIEEADTGEGRRLPSSLIEALKKRRDAVY